MTVYSQAYAFFMFALVAAMTPGPSNALLLIAGVKRGFIGGLSCVAGVVVGMASMMASAGLGLAGLISAFPQTLLVLKVAGAIFLLRLAWKIANAPPISEGGGGDPIGFWRAFAFQWVNPKSWIVSVSAASAYGAGYPGGPTSVAAMLALVFAAASTPSCLIWLGFGASLQKILTDPIYSRRFNITMAIALALSIVLVVR